MQIDLDGGNMNPVESLIKIAFELLPMGLVIFLGGGGLWFLDRYLSRRAAKVPGKGTFSRQLTLSVLAVVFLVAIIIAAPLNPDGTHDLITLFGVALTGVIALSSTTLASNAMAGLMLRAVRNFKRGDYIRVGDFLGRVTERGLFHTEIQNERSDLVTMANLYLATNPVTVIRPSGTFVSASLSLGYDIPHQKIEEHLVEAAEASGLVEPFVRINELGDFSITYEVAGRLSDTKRFLGSKTALIRAVLDTLHRHGVEIVSPNFMNQRQVGEQRFIPEAEIERPMKAAKSPAKSDPDSVVFDKADQVERADDLRKRLISLDEEIAELKTKAKGAEADEAEKVAETIARREQIREKIVARIEQLEADVKG
jgi:small conductance mechanosensitive channel